MDVNELIDMVKWLEVYALPAMRPYESLAAALQQNANNNSKVPLREPLNDLEKALMAMPVERLNYQQNEVLESLSVRQLLGEQGWNFIERAVKDGNFDPATSASDVREAKNRIENTIKKFKTLRGDLSEIGIKGEPELGSDGKITIRVVFRERTEIDNVALLKKWSSEWYDIARGVAMVADERPEDIIVKGATTGSVILILGSSLTVATIIALIMKQVASMVKSTVEISHAIEEFRMKRIINREIETALANRRKEIENTGVDESINAVKKEFDGAKEHEVEAALKKSIEKIIEFTAKGGEVDMLPPPPEFAEGDDGDATAELINTLTDNIYEVRAVKAATKLLIENLTDEMGSNRQNF